MTDKDFYDRIDKARSLVTSREAVTRYCHDIRMLEDNCSFFPPHCLSIIAKAAMSKWSEIS